MLNQALSNLPAVFRRWMLGGVMMLVLGLLAAHATGQIQGLLREVYEGIPGTAVTDLTSSPDYPDHPSSTNYVTDLFEAPLNVLDNYGQRLHGYLLAPQTGSYVFWVSSDDGGALYLSTDESPAHARLIATVMGWTSERQWEWESNQKSEPVVLQAGKVYYVAALMKEAGGGDNLAVRWQMPDGTDQGPIVATNLLPWGVSFRAPTIAQQPASFSAVEGGIATFSIVVEGGSLANYQWQRDGRNLADATGSTYVHAPVLMSDQGARFRCVATNSQGSVTSAEAILTVSPDVTPPRIVAVRSLGAGQVAVVFSEPVRGPSATTVGNYSLDKNTTISKAVFGENASTIVLTTTALTFGSNYQLTVDHILDAASAPNTIEPGSQWSFLVAEYVSVDVGGQAVAGADTFVGLGAVNVAGAGAGLDNGTDQFHFSYTEQSGSFDFKVRIQAFTAPDPWAVTGLMARESLAANSRFAASLATPAMAGCQFRTRSSTGGGTGSTGYFPVNYPETWLRLVRSGNVFAGYASLDGQNWTSLGSATLALTGTLYLGFPVASRRSTQAATVELRDIGTVTGGVIGNFLPDREPLGPSSRHTGLVISEIMYHPARRPDGRDLEFVELFNADLIAQDLTGHRLSGALDYRFPEGTVLPAGGFLVVARTPADVQNVYGLATVLGPYTNSLQNSSGSVRLHNMSGAVMLEAVYSGNPPWPAAADGAGHSLVLARPSWGEANPRAWAASEVIGGSPGSYDALRPNPQASVMINEWLAHTDDPQLDFIELYNHSNVPVDVSGCWLSDSAETHKFRIPDGAVIQPRGFAVYYQDTLGFALDARGETIYLVDPQASRVLDAVRFEGQENGVSTGRSPDGAPEFRPLTRPTPGNENEQYRVSDVVLNEIMYHPISGDSNDEYVELFNRSEAPVDLSGWKLADGIDYRFPTNTILAAQNYLVVARNAAQLRSNYPALNAQNTCGDFAGTLSNAGERLALARPELVVSTNEFGGWVTNRIYVVVDEVTYGTGGRWASQSDGGGSSLELIDAHSDHRRASNWADSDETAKAPWTTLEFTGRLDNGNGSFPANQLQMHLLGAGECLVDDVEVLIPGGPNRLANSGFTTGVTGWTFQGNHRATTWETSGGVGGGPCLHVRATGRGDTGANRIRTPLTSQLANNNTATLRAKVRWLTGWPEFLLRLRGNWLEATGPMTLPRNLGTPGARNSRSVVNAGPAIFEVTHQPVLPAANQPVVVTARLSDPDGLASIGLKYRVDPGATWIPVSMGDGGTGGDAVAGDGLYSATIPGRAAGTLAAFYVAATDAAPNAATTLFPSDAPVRECLIRWGETQPVGTLGVYRLWQTQANANRLYSREPLANDPLDATFVYGNSRVIYNLGMRAKGSPFHGGSVGSDYFFTFPEDDPALGSHEMAFITVGNLGNDDALQREQAAFWIAKELGLPYLHRRYVIFFNNGARQGQVYEDTEEPNGDYIAAWFPEDSEGDLHKIEDWFEFDDAASGFSNVDATLQPFLTTGNQLKLARYRWCWRRRAVQDSANNYTNLLALVTAANLTGPSYTAQLDNLADIEQWMRLFALEHLVGNWDAYGYSRGKNMYAYKPTRGKWALMAWDIDFVLGLSSDGATTDVFGANDPTVSTMWNNPTFLRAYWRAFQDAVNGPLQSAKIGPLLDARYQALLDNGISLSNPSAIKSWITQRRNYLDSRLKSVQAGFAVTSNGGNSFSTNKNLITLAGTAPVSVKTILVNGTAYPVSWPAVTTWNLSLPLTGRDNALALVGLDLRGQPVAGANDSITIVYTGPSPTAQEVVVLNEIMYHPSRSEAEFIEVHNTSSTSAFDLSRWRLDGVGFTFPEGSILAPGGFQVVVKNRSEFARVYGTAVLPLGEFPGQLNHAGETLRLVQPGLSPEQDRIIDAVRYGDQWPWPWQADGWGPSLQLMDPLQDNGRPANWTTVATNAPVLATPGLVNNVKTVLPPFPPVWLNEVLPDNVDGLADAAGEREPWIELYNAGSVSVDLGDLYLLSGATNPVSWPFPTGTAIQPSQFLLVWADGEPEESTAGKLHAGFRLPPTNNLVALGRLQNGSLAVLDSLAYGPLAAGRSFGSIPDGQPQVRRLLHFPTPGATNNPASPQFPVFINEWMAGNTHTLADPAQGRFEDWFELYNAGAEPADLTDYTLTDTLTNATKFVIPPGTIIAPGGFLLVWADEEPEPIQGSDLHVNFKLSLAGEAIGLLAPDGSLIDAVTFGAQTNDVSQGRLPDGGPEPFLLMDQPSPGQPNFLISANHPPVLAALDNLRSREGDLVAFIATATDPDSPEQSLTFSMAGAPRGATLDAVTGAFRWETTETDGPRAYAITVRATDNGVPRRSDAKTFTLTIEEWNQAPTLTAIADQTIDEGAALSFKAVAVDPDIPANQLTYRLEGQAPEGALLDPATGLFTWTPAEDQGPGQYPVTIGVVDNGVPPLGATQSFMVTVREVENPPVFQSIANQNLPELNRLTVPITAIDPDHPLRPVVYSLDSAPAGAVIDARTGVFTWTPGEDQGPNSYLVQVRATQAPPGGLSSRATFGISVDEVNAPPVLAPISNFVLNEGAILTFTNRAADTDLPAQTLVYTLDPGAPAGAWIDADQGVFRWAVAEDAGPSTNLITLRVTDNGAPPQTAVQPFTVVVQAPWRVVINEIMYHPERPGAEFIELKNQASQSTVDLSGFRLTGAAYVFPAGATIPPRGFLVVAKDLPVFKATYGSGLPGWGNFSGDLSKGATLQLVRPGALGEPDELIDEVTYSNRPPWPAAADGQGPSLQLIDPREDHQRADNWAALSQVTTNAPRTLITMTNQWRYWQSASSPAANWLGFDFDDSSWPAGAALLYVENAALPAPKNTPLTLGQRAYYFRTHFNFAGNPTGASLLLATIIDDGAVFYLNGTEVFRLGMPAEPVVSTTFASRTVSDAGLEGPFTLPAENLRAGDNLLAAEVHQINDTSSDIVFGAAAEVVELGRASFTPGAENSAPTLRPPLVTEIIVQPGDQIRFSWTSEPGAKYRIEYRADLESGVWQSTGLEIVAAGPVCSHTELIIPAGRRFFRVVRRE